MKNQNSVDNKLEQTMRDERGDAFVEGLKQFAKQLKQQPSKNKTSAKEGDEHGLPGKFFNPKKGAI